MAHTTYATCVEYVCTHTIDIYIYKSWKETRVRIAMKDVENRLPKSLNYFGTIYFWLKHHVGRPWTVSYGYIYGAHGVVATPWQKRQTRARREIYRSHCGSRIRPLLHCVYMCGVWGVYVRTREKKMNSRWINSNPQK